MYSVIYHMMDFIISVVLGILERLRKEKMFVEEVKLTLKPSGGWYYTVAGDSVFAQYRSKNFAFRPRISVFRETEGMKYMPTVREAMKPEKVYVTWKEVASEKFFEDVEKLFRRAGRGE